MATPTSSTSAVGRTDFAGYSGCPVLQNATTRVVLCPQSGGRVLEYAIDGKNAIYLDPDQNGRTWKRGEASFSPRGGRFDVGPEMLVPGHPTLWIGAWETEAAGPRSVRLISGLDPVLGVRLVREFTLDADSSKLTVKQTMTNRSDRTQRLCHWGRALAVGGGIVFLPLGDYSRFPRKYIQYGPGKWIQYEPEDQAVRIRGNFLEILRTPSEPKLGFDSSEGWFAYLMRNGTLFVKSYPVFPDRVYNEIAGLTVSIWYKENSQVELEPIGPMEILKPGASASFMEEWWLLDFPFPGEGEDVDLEKLEETVRNEL